MAPTPGYTRYEDLMGSFETTTALHDVLREMHRASTPSYVSYAPEQTITVTTRAVDPSEVILTRVRSSYISKKNYFMYNDL